MVLSRAEVRRLLDQLHGVHHLIATLLYGSGLRPMESLRLRVKDLDFDYEQITVRDGKGAKDRVTMLPSHAKTPLREQLSKARELHRLDLRQGIQELLGHASIQSTLIYLKLAPESASAVQSPLEQLPVLDPASASH